MATFSLTQRDHHGEAVNAITGLSEGRAHTLADVLRTGTAYTGEQPWTVEIVRELTTAEQAQEGARKWREGANEARRVNRFDRVSHIARALVDLAEDLNKLGEMEIPGSAMLAVKIQVFGQGMSTVDVLADALGQQAFRYPNGEDGSPGHYGTGHGDLMVVTTAKPELVDAVTVAPQPITPERIAEILAELNRLSSAGDNWWDWIHATREFDGEVTAAAVDTGTLHLVDGTVLRWSEEATWTAVPAPAAPFVEALSPEQVGQAATSRCGGTA